VQVPFDRVMGWIGRYDGAHPGSTWVVEAHQARAESPDGTRVAIAVPFAPLTEATMAGLAAHLAHAWQTGLVLVRRGGFAVVRLDGARVVDSKVGRRHVQGKTKAGGWSQQRFARRRDNQARAAFDATAEHAQRILGQLPRPLDLLGTGGDRRAVASVLERPELAGLRDVPRTWLGGLPDPTRAVVDQAIDSLRSVEVTITDQPDR
jgi:Actinobacteria/chloroflexi VLRF1 release factor